MTTPQNEDPYGGFDEYDHAYDTTHLMNDRTFQQAVARSSHGRRPPSSAVRPPSSFGSGNIIPSSYGRSRAGGRTAAAMRNEPARPMTAVRAAGYTSFANKVQSAEATKAAEQKDDSAEEKCKQLEKKVMDMLKESILAFDRKDFKGALEKAKEAGRKERAAVKMREQLSVVEQLNLDLTFTVLFNLAHQYMANDMTNEALNTYQVIVKNKMFANSGRLKVNIGNIYFKKKDYQKAIKYYRMALDQVPSVQKETRIKILNNIGVAFIKMGNYDDAAGTFEHCVEERADFPTALNLVLTAYCLEDGDKMRDAFQRLLDVPLDVDDDPKHNEKEDVLLHQVLNSDSLKQWERSRRTAAERAILTAARVISPAIANDYTEGYEWCVETIKQSTYAPLATELEMSKAAELLRRGDLDGASQVLHVFHNKESKIASAAANNLALLTLLQGGGKLKEAESFVEQSLQLDHYNPSALVNSGNIALLKNDLHKAHQFYKDALQNDSTCVQALYNMGLVCRQLGNVEQALEYFYKLHNILLNNVQVLCQLAAIYESLEDTAQAIELYSQANSLCPSDPAILQKLGSIYDAEGDKSQAFHATHDSVRYFPSNMRGLEWMGAYYIDAQFSEKAVSYFERASIMQPNEIKWQLMMASSYRRAGNYHKALELYRNIHRRFPTNIECLKFLVRITTDMKTVDAGEFAEKLEKAEKVRQLRMQRESDSSQGKRSAHSAHSLPVPGGSAVDRPTSLNSLRNASGGGGGGGGAVGAGRGGFDFDDSQPFQVTQKDMNTIDLSYSDPLGPTAQRPKTGSRRVAKDDSFEEFDDNMLPQ